VLVVKITNIMSALTVKTIIRQNYVIVIATKPCMITATDIFLR